jgi:hypothetical protein
VDIATHNECGNKNLVATPSSGNMGNCHIVRVVAIRCRCYKVSIATQSEDILPQKIGLPIFTFTTLFGLVLPDNIASPLIRNSIDINKAFVQIPLNKNINLFNLFTFEIKRSKFKLRLHTHC